MLHPIGNGCHVLRITFEMFRRLILYMRYDDNIRTRIR